RTRRRQRPADTAAPPAPAPVTSVVGPDGAMALRGRGRRTRRRQRPADTAAPPAPAPVTSVVGPDGAMAPRGRGRRTRRRQRLSVRPTRPPRPHPPR
ncbi:hypothetical protein ACWDAZ_28570, partial [Streptomyces sp. NPDC001215]